MQFESVADFLAMGGYGKYVWLSFGIAAVAVAALIVQTVAEHGALRRRKLRLTRRGGRS